MSDSKKTTKRPSAKHAEFARLWLVLRTDMMMLNEMHKLEPERLEAICEVVAWKLFLKMRQQNN